MRLIGILGPSYCGSTVVSCVLDGLPGVTSVGEAHWLTDMPTFAPCSECAPHSAGKGVWTPEKDCPVFTAETRPAVAKPLWSWYAHLAKTLGIDGVMVSSDKYCDHFKRFGRPDKAIVVYKDRRAQVASLIRHRDDIAAAQERRGEVGPAPIVSMEVAARQGANTTAQIHGINLAYLDENNIPAVSLPIEMLAVRPYNTLRALCGFLGVDCDFNALDYWAKPHHQIAGNFAAAKGHVEKYPTTTAWDRCFTKRIGRDERWRDELPPAALAVVHEHKALGEVYARLDAMAVLT